MTRTSRMAMQPKASNRASNKANRVTDLPSRSTNTSQSASPDLPNEIYDLIISKIHYESPWSLRSLRLVSRRWKEQADVHFFHHLELEDIPEKGVLQNAGIKSRKARNEHYVHRLTGASDGLPRLIRWFGIVNSSRGRRGLPSEDMVKMLSGMKNLRNFSWTSAAEIPDEVIEHLEQNHPGVRIHVQSERTPDKWQQNQAMRLFMSPLIYSINHNLFWRTFKKPLYSDLPKFTRVLLAVPESKLRRLAIHLSMTTGPPDDMEKQNTVTFPVAEGDRFHPLESLSLSGGSMSSTPGYQHMFETILSHLDLSAMRELDLDITLQWLDTSITKLLTHKVPNLRSLVLKGGEPGTIASLVRSITALESFTLRGAKEEHYEELMPALMQHSKSLWRLCIRSENAGNFVNPHRIHMLWKTHLELLVSSFPSLRDVELSINLREPVPNTLVWRDDITTILARMSHIRRLHLLSQPPMTEGEVDGSIDGISEAAETIALQVWNAFFEASRTAALEVVEVKLTDHPDDGTHWSMNISAEPEVSVSRAERDDTGKPWEETGREVNRKDWGSRWGPLGRALPGIKTVRI